MRSTYSWLIRLQRQIKLSLNLIKKKLNWFLNSHHQQTLSCSAPHKNHLNCAEFSKHINTLMVMTVESNINNLNEIFNQE